jgi:hypothetical protein
MRRWMLALVVGTSVLASGCGEEKKNDPKPPPGTGLKPLAPPGSPGGQPNPKAPGAGPNAQ